MRIASLLPAATEIVGALGLADDLVAVTFECDRPEGIRATRPVVVDTALPAGPTPGEIDAIVRDRAARNLPQYELDRDALRDAAPDLVLTQDLCRVCALPESTVTEALADLDLDATVLTVDPHTLDEVLDAVAAVARAAGAPDAGTDLVAGLQERLTAIDQAVGGRPRPRVLALEWVDPPFLPGHWVPAMVRRAGGEPLAGIDGGRSVATSWEEVAAQDPDVVLVAPCGFGLDDAVAQAEEVRERLPGVPMVAVDSASYVVRAGPRLVDGIEAIAHALHPDAVPAPPPGRITRLS
ncbi:iron complex transport system substrate-binding protein [Actinomycetospora succinea]|uniref:Iron complex transport system substrate-binding protein n=1 Tax=Actinomycetospora succinea TaxID=663603 RepID=A0A4R6VEC9_9PSEU|nr:ABC transporter substrate-binding protein [Actinomycetospora succinea]TDQ61122.1 iron complex transport system substrate-binding protein [Actinomycetospora succinea]